MDVQVIPDAGDDQGPQGWTAALTEKREQVSVAEEHQEEHHMHRFLPIPGLVGLGILIGLAAAGFMSTPTKAP